MCTPSAPATPPLSNAVLSIRIATAIPAGAPYPTSAQIATIQATWNSLVDADNAAARRESIATVGVAVFHNLFAAAPHAADLFSFKDPAKGGAINATKLRKHAGVAFCAVDGLIADLADAPATAATLTGVAQGHLKYSVQEAHYGVLLAAIVQTLGGALGPRWTGEAQAAWGALAAAIKAAVHAVYAQTEA